MVVKDYFMRWLVLAGLLFLLAGLMATADEVPGVAPCPGGCRCLPNARAYGYFPTRWREWPGEPRPDKVFPQVIGRELLPTPAGTEALPPPKEVIKPEAATPPPPPTPPQGAPEGVLPRGKELPPVQQPLQPAPVNPNAPLPGLPLEPETPLPQNPSMQAPLPGLPLEGTPPMPAAPPVQPGLPSLSPQPESPFQMEPLSPQPGKDAEPKKQSRYNPDRTQHLLSRAAWENQATASALSGNGVARADWQAGAPPTGRPPYPANGLPPRPANGQQVAYQSSFEAQSRLPVNHPESALSNMPPGLNGYCPVELLENEKWVSGDRRWAVVHQGRTYLLSGPEQQQRFLANPNRYCPVFAGSDPVLAVDENRQVPGRTDFCVVYDGRLFMFSGAYSLSRFRQEPNRYTAAAQPTRY
jgi:YHS domain-containing protein